MNTVDIYNEIRKDKLIILFFTFLIFIGLAFGAGFIFGFNTASDFCIAAAEKLLHVEFKEGVIAEIEARFGKVLEVLNE